MTVIVNQIVLSIPKMTVQVKNQNDRFQNARSSAFIHRIRKLTVISTLASVPKILVQTQVQTRVQRAGLRYRVQIRVRKFQPLSTELKKVSL